MSTRYDLARAASKEMLLLSRDIQEYTGDIETAKALRSVAACILSREEELEKARGAKEPTTSVEDRLERPERAVGGSTESRLADSGQRVDITEGTEKRLPKERANDESRETDLSSTRSGQDKNARDYWA